MLFERQRLLLSILDSLETPASAPAAEATFISTPTAGNAWPFPAFTFRSPPIASHVTRILATGRANPAADATFLRRACQNGRRPAPSKIAIWNDHMRRLGWRDGGTPRLDGARKRLPKKTTSRHPNLL
jgi:hypothetical protein